MLKQEFWCLKGPESTARLARWGKDMDYESTVSCSVNDGHQRAGKRLPQLSVDLPQTVRDFVWTWHSDCLIQDSVLELFKDNAFTGLDVKPVKAKFRRGGGDPPRLWELVATGWGGMAPCESGIRLIERCAACGLHVYSAWNNPENLIDYSQWDGSDFFIVWPLPGFTFVTERVARVIRDNKLSGIALKRSSDLVFSPHVIPKLSPGRLSDWMRPQRARKLGGALGID
jgi:hypothetical protein